MLSKFNKLFSWKVLLASAIALAGIVFAEGKADVDAVDATFAVSHYALDTIVMFICAVLVLFMQAGFAMVEAGFNAAKNTVNILFKNVMDLSVGVLLYYLIGFNLMYPADWIIPNILGTSSAGIGGDMDYGYVSWQVDFLFQVAFAATAATIVSGAVAGRMKFVGYLVYSALLTGIIYPISGSWQWGGGWLAEMGFHDFAGSGIVHMVGGFAGLAGAMVLGPRIGRFTDGKSNPMPGHNITLATLGVFILWIGWYGFNPGSVLAAGSAAEAELVVLVAVNTTLAAALGAIGAMVLGWILSKKPDLMFALNGALAGLVAITANADAVTNASSIWIGLIGGFVVVLAIYLLDMLKIDDPVGAWPVHGAAGMWGLIATGLFGEGKDIVAQIVGTFAYAIWPFAIMLLVFLGLKVVGMLRVSEEDEMKGLDQSEHGMDGYGS